jgi:quercetin dioxygenase-like cupin family protein
MNRRRITTVLSAFAAGVLVGAAIPSFSAAGPKVTNLLTAALSTEFTPDRAVLIDLVEIPPNQTLDWHWHPGEEFHYYLEGDPVIELDGAPSIIGTPGTIGHVAFKRRHRATAGGKGARIVVFRVHTTGAPWRHPDDTKDEKRTSN